MKIALVMDNEHNLTPLDIGEQLAIIDEEKKVVEVYDNPGFGVPHGGKEMTMDAILQLEAEAVVVKKAFLCPGSYGMSQGRIKYIVTDAKNLDEVISNLPKVKENMKDELEPELYAEEEHAHF